MQNRTLEEWLAARDRTLAVKAEVVSPTLMAKTLKKIVKGRETGEHKHKYGQYACSRVLYLKGNDAVQAYTLTPDPEEGDWYLKIDKSMTKNFVQNLGVPNATIQSLIGQRIVCLWAKDSPEVWPDLKRIALLTDDNRDLVDKSLDDLAGPLSPAMFNSVDLSSIQKNVWF
jgi:hypothetical protein